MASLYRRPGAASRDKTRQAASLPGHPAVRIQRGRAGKHRHSAPDYKTGSTRRIPSTRAHSPGDLRAQLTARYRAVRGLSERLAAPLSAEDQCLQGMPDASPTKWHLAHTTWFFETAVLAALVPDYRPVDERYAYLFNSYYEAVGPRHHQHVTGEGTARHARRFGRRVTPTR